MAFTEQSIQRFVENYWPLPAPIAAMHQFQTQGYLKYIGYEKGRRRVETKLQEEYDTFLQQAFGDEVGTYLRLCKSDIKGSQYHALYDHLYRTGMSEYAPVKIVLRSRATLESLLKLLSSQEQPFSILDLGCGDARVAGGIALAFKHLQKVYAVDCNLFAFQAMERWIERLSSSQKDVVRQKIVPINKNYEDASFKERSEIQADIALIACLPTLSKVLPAAKAHCPQGTFIAYFPSSPPTTPGLELEFQVNTVARPHGVHFQCVDEKRYWSNAAVAAFRTP